MTSRPDRLARLALEGLDQPVAVLDPEGTYLYVTPAYAAVLGLPEDALPGTAAAAHGPEALAAAVRTAATGREHARATLTLEPPTGGGAARSLDVEVTPVEMDGARVLLARISDVPPQPADVLRSLSLLEATLESTADGLLIVDREGRIARYNRRFARMWGLSEQVLASRDDETALAEAMRKVKDPERFLERVRELYAQPEATSFDTFELTDGRVFERYSRPQRVGDEIVGRVWSFRDVTMRARAEEALRESEARYRRLFEDSRHAIYLTTVDGRFVDVNPAARALFGLTEETDFKHLNARDFYVDPTERDAFAEAIERAGRVTDYPVRLRGPDGRVMECLLSATARYDENGRVVGYQGIIEDVTERVRTERALRESEQKFRSLIENASDTITILDAHGSIVYESPSLERVLGYRPDDLIGRNVFEFVHPDDRDRAVLQFGRLLGVSGSVTRLEVRFLHGRGDWRVLEVVGRNLLDDPSIQGIVVNARDVTDRKEAEARLLHDAFHDRLTQLPNRALFVDRMRQALRRARRQDEEPFSVLFLDLDRFKVVNDSLGHTVGDQLLIALARRLESVLRPGDTVARLGGDEFTMLLEGAGRAEAQAVAERVHEALKRPVQVGSHEIYATMSIGIATVDGTYEHPEELLRDADLAMYRAKEEGRARFAFFDAAMRESAVRQLELETALRRALERGEFEVFYQPIVRLDDGRLYGFEALIRWRHPERGLLLPAEFLPVAEDTGIIVPIGWAVLRSVGETVREWSERFGAAACPVQVNVSAHQMQREDFVNQVRAAIHDTGAPGTLLHLELTESTMMENAERTIATLRELKAMGIGVSIDDFGTGYSSLSYLHRFPTDSVKIDRSFVADMGPLARDSGMVRTIVDLAHDLGMRVVAEGIETEAQVSALRGMRCECGQGFLFARPLSAGDATELLEARRVW